MSDQVGCIKVSSAYSHHEFALLQAVFGDVRMPITARGCNCGHCLSKNELRDLLNSDQERLLKSDLFGYMSNVFITIGGRSDFLYLLPAILRIWASEIYLLESPFSGFVYRGLLKVRKHLNCEQTSCIKTFMRNRLLERLGTETSLLVLQRTSSHVWPEHICSYGVVFSDIPELFNQWFSLRCAGHAVSFLQYLSCLLFDSSDNPIFKSTIPIIGSVTQLDGHWKRENIGFIKGIMRREYLLNRLEAVSSILGQQPAITAIAHKVRNSEGWVCRKLSEIVKSLE